MALNQYTGDDGAVIGYKPDLDYNKDRKTEYDQEAVQETSNTDITGEYIFSSAVSGFENNTPSKLLNDLGFVISNIQSIIQKFPEYFISKGYGDYDDISMLTAMIAAADEDGIQAYVDYHFKNIQGSIIPELMQNEYEALKRVQRIENRIKYLYYGNENGDTQSFKEIDDGFLEKIHKYESSGMGYKINYPMIAMDSMLNRSLSSYVFDVNKYSIIMGNIPKNSTEYSKNGSKNTVLSMFDDTVSALEARKKAFGMNQTVEILDKTLYNYYMQRQKLLDLYDLMGNSESKFLGRQVQNTQMQIEEAVKNVTRIVMGISTHLKEMSSLEEEKLYLMDIYEGLSYNL